MPPSFWPAAPGTLLRVFTRKPGETEEKEELPPLPVAGWGDGHGPDDWEFVPAVPTVDGVLLLFRIDRREEEGPARNQRLAARFGWVGRQVVRAILILPHTLPMSVLGQVHVRSADHP